MITERAEHGTSTASMETTSRSRGLSRMRVDITAGTLQP